METTRNKALNIHTTSDLTQSIWHLRLFKRMFDITVSALGLIFLSPFFAILALLIKMDSRGPVLFRGARVGRDGKIFQILKFRTMYESLESYQGARITAQGDNRITSLGKWLRNTKLNELPQLWNVFVGEMSLVGPRPEDPLIVASWPDDARKEILSIRPGITSPASIAYHDEEKIISHDNLMGDYMGKILPDKLRLDRLYVRHHTFMTDLDAIFWTLIVLVPRLSKIRRSEGWLFGGPFTRLSRFYLSWTVSDFVTALISAGLVGVIWRIFAPLDIGWNRAPLVALFLAVEFGFVNFILGLGHVEWSRAVAEDVFILFVSCGIVTMISVVVDMFVTVINLPAGYVLAVSLVTLLGFILNRYQLHILTGFAKRWVNLWHKGYGTGERVLVVGAGAGGEMIVWLLQRPEFQRLFYLVGYVDDDPIKQGMRYDGYSVLGTIADLPALVDEQDIGVIFFTIKKILAEDRERILSVCRKAGVRLILLSDMLKRIEEHIVPEMVNE